MSNNLSNSNTIMAGIKEVGHKVFGGYAELLRIPHTARYSIGSVIACMPFPMAVSYTHLDVYKRQEVSLIC